MCKYIQRYLPFISSYSTLDPDLLKRGTESGCSIILNSIISKRCLIKKNHNAQNKFSTRLFTRSEHPKQSAAFVSKFIWIIQSVSLPIIAFEIYILISNISCIHYKIRNPGGSYWISMRLCPILVLRISRR